MVTVSSSPEGTDKAISIIPSTEELQKAAYASPNVQKALEALHQDGFVVLKSVVDVSHVEALNKVMSKEADELVRNNTKPFNQGVNCMYFDASLCFLVFNSLSLCLSGFLLVVFECRCVMLQAN